MPHINIKLFPGRDNDTKHKIAESVAKVLSETASVSEGSVSVSIEEIEKENWPKVYKSEIIDKKQLIYKEPTYNYTEEEIENSRIVEKTMGKGKAIIKSLIDKEVMLNNARMFSQVTLKKGCSVGYHEHHNETEVYYILSGKGSYNDNGTIREIKAGDVTVTPNNQGHGIENTGEEDLVFIALILTF